jgi:hypothetical protein
MRYETERTLAARVKALGESAEAGAFAELADFCASPSPLVRRLAASALGKLAGVVDAQRAVDTLLPLLVDPHPQVRQYARSQRFFQRTLCDPCFDETCTERRNTETKIEDQKQIRTLDGTLVQSDGERRIAEWLAANRIAYRYDARLRIIEGFQIRPDFYLPEYDVYIEYWGMDTPRYKAGMYLKQDLYMHAGKRLISLYPEDKLRLDTILRDKLATFMRHPTASDDAKSAGAPVTDKPHDR